MWCLYFSSYYSHHICTLEGGLTCFKENSDFKIAKSVRSHGWTRHLDKEEKIFKEYSKIDPGFLFNFVGYNLRLSEPQAAIGIQQIRKLDEFINNRIKSANILTGFFEFLKKKNKSKIVCLTAYSKNIAEEVDKHADIVFGLETHLAQYYIIIHLQKKSLWMKWSIILRV